MIKFNQIVPWRPLLAAVLVVVCGNANSQSDGLVEPLRIAVYGASGRMGSVIVSEALSREHLVTGIGRDPSSITERHANLTTARGDITDVESVTDLIAGYDVVVNAVRGDTSTGDPEQSLTVLSTKALVAALRRLAPEAPRMLMVGGGSSLEPGPDYEKWPTRGPEEIHLIALSFLRSVTDVSWTTLSPPMGGTGGDSGRTGTYRIGGDVVLRNAAGEFAPISRQDFAVAMLDEIENPKHDRRRFTVAY